MPSTARTTETRDGATGSTTAAQAGLGIRARTVSTHVCNILCKLSVETRLAAAMQVVRVIICRRPAD